MFKLIERLIAVIIAYFISVSMIFLFGLDIFLIFQAVIQIVMGNDVLFICYMVLISLDTSLLAGIAYWLQD